MSYRLISGFEAGDKTEMRSSSGSAYSFSTSTVRSGTYALRINPTTTGTTFLEVNGRNSAGASAELNLSTIYCRLYFRAASLPASNYEPFFASISGTGVYKFTLAIGSDGKLRVLNQAGTLVATGTSVLSTGTWYRIEVMAGTGTSASYLLQVDGATELSGTMDTTTSNHNRVLFGKTQNLYGNSVDFYYDDVALKSDSFPGPGRVAALVPESNGTDTGFTASSGEKWECLNERPHNSDTDYISSNIDLDHYTANTTSGGVSGTVKCVSSYIVAKRASTGAVCHVWLRHLTTVNQTTDFTLGSSYASLSKLYETDIADGGAWSADDIGELQVGASVVGSVTVMVTQALVMVEYDPSAISMRDASSSLFLSASAGRAANWLREASGAFSLTQSVGRFISLGRGAESSLAVSAAGMAGSFFVQFVGEGLALSLGVSRSHLLQMAASIGLSLSVLASRFGIYQRIASGSLSVEAATSSFSGEAFWLPVVLLATDGFTPLIGVPYSDVSVRYISSGGVAGTKALSPLEWEEGGNGVYRIRFSTSLMGNFGRFIYLVSHPSARTYRGSYRVEGKRAKPTSYLYTVTNSANGNPIKKAWVWVTRDPEGKEMIGGPTKTDKLGTTRWFLDRGTYYFWVHAPGYSFSNPDKEEI